MGGPAKTVESVSFGPGAEGRKGGGGRGHVTGVTGPQTGERQRDRSTGKRQGQPKGRECPATGLLGARWLPGAGKRQHPRKGVIGGGEWPEGRPLHPRRLLTGPPTHLGRRGSYDGPTGVLIYCCPENSASPLPLPTPRKEATITTTATPRPHS